MRCPRASVTRPGAASADDPTAERAQSCSVSADNARSAHTRAPGRGSKSGRGERCVDAQAAIDPVPSMYAAAAGCARAFLAAVRRHDVRRHRTNDARAPHRNRDRAVATVCRRQRWGARVSMRHAERSPLQETRSHPRRGGHVSSLQRGVALRRAPCPRSCEHGSSWRPSIARSTRARLPRARCTPGWPGRPRGSRPVYESPTNSTGESSSAGVSDGRRYRRWTQTAERDGSGAGATTAAAPTVTIGSAGRSAPTPASPYLARRQPQRLPRSGPSRCRFGPMCESSHAHETRHHRNEWNADGCRERSRRVSF